MQQRLESSRAGRAAISVFIVFTIVSVVVWNLPPSALKDDALAVTGPYIRATGLNQNWGVFSPNPRRHSLLLFARVRYADGSEEVLSTAARRPPGRRLLGLPLEEVGRVDEHRRAQRALAPAADWFARRARAQGRDPVTVTLVRRWRDLLPPGPRPEQRRMAGVRRTTRTRSRAPARRKPGDEGARDLGAVLVQRRGDVHARPLQDRLRRRGRRLDDLARPGAVLVLRRRRHPPEPSRR